MMVEEKERLIRLDKIINSEECFDKLYTLVKDVELLLNRQFSSKSSTWFRSNYNNKLIELDLANINGQVRQKELISSFNYYYSKDLLCILQSNVKVDNENNWLSQIVRKHRKTFHPLRHLLLIQFLDISLDELFNEKIEVKPFGEGPWPCLNAGAEHYLKDMIHDVDITYDSKSKKPIGTFKCKCGFIYSRSGPDIDNMDRYKVGRVKKSGREKAFIKTNSKRVKS